MTKKTRITVLLFALLFFAVMLFSFGFIAINAEHECHDENCKICHCIALCKNIFNCNSIAFTVVFTSLLTFSDLLLAAFAKRHINGSFLIALKVKLSN